MTSHNPLDHLRNALLKLTPAQQVAVEALPGGATHHAAAEAAGGTRETVTRWAGHVPAFKASLSLYRFSIVAEQLDTARRIRGKALTAIERALDRSEIDPLAVLRVVGDSASSIGPTIAEAMLDAETNTTRIGLPPAPPPQGLDAILESLEAPPPSSAERAEVRADHPNGRSGWH